MQTAQQTKQTAQAKQTKQTASKTTLLDGVIAKINKAMTKDNNITMQQVTGYISVKYGNKVLFELHAKKKAITHLTFAQTQNIYKFLKDNKLIMRVVSKSYGWKYDTECLLNDEFYKHFDTILQSVIQQAIDERNLKQQKQQKQEVKTA